GRIQFMCNRDLTTVDGLVSDEVRPLKFIEKKVDLGDIVGIEGHLFRTQKGELTICVTKFTLLCKTLLSLPDKHAGIADKGVRYRKRWLDLITDQDSMNIFFMRSAIVKMTREYMGEHNFIEVETPVLQNNYGGAEARPFQSHLNSLDQEMFLRISLEIPLKKLIVGGMSKIFEIGKVFRNEGIDRTHNPEFTMMEAYAAYLDYNDVMELTENLFETIAKKLFGTTKITRADKSGTEHEIDLKAPWKRLTMKEAIKTYGKIDVDTKSDKELTDLVKKHSDDNPKKIEQMPRGKKIAVLFEETAEHHLIQPHHITDHPIETTPLCKPHRNPDDRADGLVERFESFILGYEFCNAYSELNDPVIQRDLLEKQAEQKDAGDDEANPMDEEFIEAICQGMPPTGGLGVGIDRLTMLFTGVPSIRDILYFPLMKPDNS
ncbi:MAG: lysine--tRNA ligase, partial [Simkaniaceae bacterium]|nr:lysine--tRNA ligase [Simkaniaceae bacterium]